MSDTGLRQRKGGAASSGSADAQSAREQAEKYVKGLGSMAPEAIKPYVIQAAPYVGEGANFMVETVIPFLRHVYQLALELWELLRPYKPELLGPALIGLILCFFGGSFLTLVAAAEAYKMMSHETIMKCVNDLYDDFNKFIAESKKDDKVDADGNGVADVQEISGDKLVNRKVMLFLRTVDPARVQTALTGLANAFFGIVATLKVRFVKSITLGNSLSNIVIEGPAKQYIVPQAKVLLGPQYERWAEPLVVYLVRSIAISLAWMVQRVISALHSAVRGGNMFASNVLDYLVDRSIIKAEDRQAQNYDKILGYGIAVVGIWWQISRGFSLPFPLNILLLPFVLLEWLLIWAVRS